MDSKFTQTRRCLETPVILHLKHNPLEPQGVRALVNMKCLNMARRNGVVGEPAKVRCYRGRIALWTALRQFCWARFHFLALISVRGVMETP